MAFDSDHVSINFSWVNLFIILCLLSVRSVDAWAPNTGSRLCSYFFLSFWHLTNVRLACLTVFLSSRVCQFFNTLGTFDFIKFFFLSDIGTDNYRIHLRKILRFLVSYYHWQSEDLWRLKFFCVDFRIRWDN